MPICAGSVWPFKTDYLVGSFPHAHATYQRVCVDAKETKINSRQNIYGLHQSC